MSDFRTFVRSTNVDYPVYFVARVRHRHTWHGDQPPRPLGVRHRHTHYQLAPASMPAERTAAVCTRPSRRRHGARHRPAHIIRIVAIPTHAIAYNYNSGSNRHAATAAACLFLPGAAAPREPPRQGPTHSTQPRSSRSNMRARCREQAAQERDEAPSRPASGAPARSLTQLLTHTS